METSKFEKSSVVTGHHVYKTNWTPSIGEVLALQTEEDNHHDKFAVSVMKDGEIVGHLPRCLSKISFYFLKRGGEINCTVVGKRKKGKGLEVPCLYIYAGPSTIVRKLERLLK